MPSSFHFTENFRMIALSASPADGIGLVDSPINVGEYHSSVQALEVKGMHTRVAFTIPAGKEQTFRLLELQEAHKKKISGLRMR